MKRYINTIENLYHSIYFVGQDNEIEWYLHGNKNITFVKADVLKEDGGKYTIDREIEDDSMVLYTGEYRPQKTVDKNGKRHVACFDGENFHMIDGDVDIDTVILPKLRNHGVKIIRCYAPDMSKVDGNGVAKWSMRCWRTLRRLSPTWFGRLRHFVRKTRYLQKEQGGLTNDMSRGYSVMYANGKYINFEDGFRRTVRNEDIESKGNIFIFGPCFVRGLAQDDGNTVASIVQKNFPDRKVWNYGSEFGTLNFIMRIPEYHAGDVAIIFDIKKRGEDKERICDAHYDMTDTWRSVPHLWRHLFDDPMHYDNRIHGQMSADLAKAIASVIRKDKTSDNMPRATVFFGPKIKRAAHVRLFSEDNDLLEWISHVEKMAPYAGGKRGTIVMNCNPFTNGHRYLIETARRKVDELIVFVLQEDKSDFSYDDRITLVRQGTDGLDNVRVFPSGKHMISAQTLPGYFNKRELSDTVVDLSCDLDFFARIAETLHISIRFAGMEPLDPFTNRYNQKMSEYLPKYGMEFEEIERIKADGDVISASCVREYLKNGEWNKIKKLVPETTFKFLAERYAFGENR